MIPKSFQLLGYKWRVRMVVGLKEVSSGDKLDGYCDFQKHLVFVEAGLPPAEQWHTFLHELLHASLEAIGRPELSASEGFVDALSGALAQALPTRKVRAPRRAASSSRKK